MFPVMMFGVVFALGMLALSGFRWRHHQRREGESRYRQNQH